MAVFAGDATCVGATGARPYTGGIVPISIMTISLVTIKMSIRPRGSTDISPHRAYTGSPLRKERCSFSELRPTRKCGSPDCDSRIY